MPANAPSVPTAAPRLLLGVDVGGTFTDAALFDGERLHTAKVPTTPADQSEGVLAAVDAALEQAGAAAGDVGGFAHGMTVGTNALLTGSGARTAFIATRGFSDLLEIARQNRPRLYHPCAPKPAPLVPADLRFGADERVGPEGIEAGLREDEITRICAELESAQPEAVAICLLFSHVAPKHEAELATAIRRHLPGVHVSASHEVLPQFREYERASTTVIDAYLAPLLGRYLGSLAAAAQERGLPEPLVMRSSGGVAPLAEAAQGGAWSVLSGPAGGAVGAGLLAGASGDGNALGFDMGGTSCDVCVIQDGSVRRTDSREIEGRPIQLPMVDVHTVGAGGGSIAWRDSGGALRVGPRSAGSEPGPACYGRGGAEPTVTDANLVLGRLAPDSSLAGEVELDGEAARSAIARLAAELGLDETETAAGILRVADQEMVRALRVVTVERGIDPRAFALLPFGGAGPMHAAAIAAELEIRRILCPRASGVLSALGLLASDRRRDVARTVMIGEAEMTAARLAAEVAALARGAAQGMSDPEIQVVCEMRYSGQAFELPVESTATPDPTRIAADFAAAHEARYGHRDTDSPVELVNLRVAAIEPGPHPEPRAAEAGGLTEVSRRVWFGGEAWAETRVLRGEPAAGTTAEGPCIFELPEATLVLPPGWRAEVDAAGTIVAEVSQ